MAWTAISNALVAVGALPFATTIQALRDNPIAIANGDAGAPRVQLPAISGALAVVPLGSVGSYAFVRSVAGSGITLNLNSVYSGSQLNYTSSDKNFGPSVGSGSWRIMGQANDSTSATLALRIS